MEKQEIEVIGRKAISLHDQALSIVVEDRKTLLAANEFAKAIKSAEKKINEFFGPLIKKAHAAHKALCDQKNAVMAPVLEADNINKRKIGAYLAQEERKRREAEERARVEKEKAEREAKEAEEKALQAALKAQEDGKPEEAEKIIEQFEAPKVAQPLVPGKIAVQGTHLRVNWKWRLKDIEKVPRDFLKLDEVKIGAVVRATKDKTKIPGIEVYGEPIGVTKAP